jgi:Serine hydrolase (FSH1)
MTQGFREHFASLADFHFIDAPYDIDPEILPPEPALTQRGFLPPFKAWFMPMPMNGKSVVDMVQEYADSHDPLPEDLEYHVSVGIEKSVDLVADTIREHGPFDGALSFSQGCAVFRIFNFVT